MQIVVAMPTLTSSFVVYSVVYAWHFACFPSWFVGEGGFQAKKVYARATVRVGQLPIANKTWCRLTQIDERVIVEKSSRLSSDVLLHVGRSYFYDSGRINILSDLLITSDPRPNVEAKIENLGKAYRANPVFLTGLCDRRDCALW
jgi:hypothetical protein